MKRLFILLFALSFLTFSCRTSKDNNIYVDHSKEKKVYSKSADKKYSKSKKRNKSKKK